MEEAAESSSESENEKEDSEVDEDYMVEIKGGKIQKMKFDRMDQESQEVSDSLLIFLLLQFILGRWKRGQAGHVAKDVAWSGWRRWRLQPMSRYIEVSLRVSSFNFRFFQKVGKNLVFSGKNFNLRLRIRGLWSFEWN